MTTEEPQAQAPPESISPAEADRRAHEAKDDFSRRPELYVGAAFAGAFVAAQLLKRLTGGGE